MELPWDGEYGLSGFLEAKLSDLLLFLFVQTWSLWEGEEGKGQDFVVREGYHRWERSHVEMIGVEVEAAGAGRPCRGHQGLGRELQGENLICVGDISIMCSGYQESSPRSLINPGLHSFTCQPVSLFQAGMWPRGEKKRSTARLCQSWPCILGK